MGENRSLGLSVFFTDFLIISFGVYFIPEHQRIFFYESRINSAVFYSILFCGINVFNNVYFSFHKIDSSHLAKKIIQVYSIFIFVIFFILWRISAESNHLDFGYKYILFLFVYIPILTSLSRLLFILIRKKWRTMNPERRQNLLVIGDIKLVNLIYDQQASKMQTDYNLIGFYSDEIPKEKDLADLCLGKIEDVNINNNSKYVNYILCSLGIYNRNPVIQQVLNDADNCMAKVHFVETDFVYNNQTMMLDYNSIMPVFSTRKEPLDDDKNFTIKRLFDIIIAIMVNIFILSWLIPVIGLLIRLESKGPVFFIQKRTGYDNHEFNCLKFRSMYINNEANKSQATKDDIRTTKIGKFLRKTNLDEMPQFINVLKGDMSIVGPRPHMIAHTEYYSKEIEMYMVRQYVLPGITGWAQVMGCRGETKKEEDMARRVHYDIWYLENWTIWLDIKIIVLTIIQVIKGDPKAY
jgi:putative colanic acid biosysnthesis UDP-glucose lipid carrier transferase